MSEILMIDNDNFTEYRDTEKDLTATFWKKEGEYIARQSIFRHSIFITILLENPQTVFNQLKYLKDKESKNLAK